MKKKILFALIACLFVCLLALTVSASNEVTLTSGEKADLEDVFNVQTKNGVVQITGFNSGYSKNDVTDVIFPDEIDGLEANFLFGEATSLKTITFEATDTFFISGDNIFTKCSVEKITFNPNCIVEIRKGNFSNCTSLTEITFPKFRKLAGSSFASCSSMVATNELILVEGMTEIGGHAFNGCTSLSGTVVFPSTLEKIQEYSFQKTGFSEFDLSKCANLTLVGGGYGGPFTDNDNITKLDLSGCTSLTKLKANFASNSDNLTEVILPPNLTEIPSKAFAHCYKMQSIVLPASVTAIADEAFHSTRRNQDIKTFTVYVQSNVKFGENYPFRDSSAKIEYVLIGDGVTAESFIAANTFSGVTGASVVDYKDAYNYTVGQAITAHTIVENYCASLALSGAHASDENPCVILCSDCGLSAKKENPQHNYDVAIVYENGFGNEGKKTSICTSAGCGHEVAEAVPALIVSLGYSIAEEGAAGVDIGFKVNKAAVLDYEETMGKTVNFGVFAALESTLGENDVFDSEGNALNGVIAADMTDTDYSIFRIKMAGFDDNQKTIAFAMGAFIKTTAAGGTQECAYLQIAAPSDGSKYYYASYNEMLGK